MEEKRGKMMIEQIVNRLKFYGYDASINDKVLISYILEKIQTGIKIDCNIDVVPNELDSIVIDRVIGTFLMEKKALDPESIKYIDLGGIATQVTEGDTSVTLSVTKTPEERLDEVINYLLHKDYDLSCYRKIVW